MHHKCIPPPPLHIYVERSIIKYQKQLNSLSVVQQHLDIRRSDDNCDVRERARLLLVLNFVLVDLEVSERVGVLCGGDDTASEERAR